MPPAASMRMSGGGIARLLLVLIFVDTTATAAAPPPRPGPGDGPEPITPIPAPPAQDPLRLALGEQLFQDTRLSGDNTRSCANCHDLTSNGASANAHDVTSEGRPLGCISCHQGVNVGGNMYQRHGIFHPLAAPLPELLRVPSLRNVAATPPYFHDGSATTLRQAVKAMGFAQLDRVLTASQITAIVAFLNTLTGVYRGAPVKPAAGPQGVAQ